MKGLFSEGRGVFVAVAVEWANGKLVGCSQMGRNGVGHHFAATLWVIHHAEQIFHFGSQNEIATH